eukprot:Protomagalhaensia_wolfi_Nauph_80__1095@NODE_163_length_3360_cov_203_906354_g101_i1_p2_GENE_NODE_163_length_3360_cov_203_906354_g101_i1NODE_163_length_3360_cov_203_906354_g101_i1_p2_ORF_typecomplete_len281_score31_11CH/PF00307_31/0_00031CH/PF00307_31/1_3e04CH_2/PF06294_11/0_0023CH_2/PF06294_11/2_7e03CAMSAP_CH/PF11971_8/0_011DUF3498/PF12004_8/0_016DMPK_coil/PF08826_10/0_072BST2/PF16716_5/0_086EB1/PF03271_17/0_074DUF1192/PF06698_11/0_13Mto2_bdg/PF12808_7/0_22Med21/PF11221_8/0_18HalX/PF08663_10/0_18
MSDNVGIIGTMSDAFFQPKRKLLDWLKQDFECNIQRLEDCTNGAMYLQILDRAYPGKVPMQKVHWGALHSYEMTKNYKLLQEVLPECGLVRSFDIANLINRRSQDLLELLQWMKHVYDKRMETLMLEPYKPLERRQSGHGPFPEWTKNKQTVPFLPTHHREASNSLRQPSGGGSTRHAPSAKAASSGLRKTSSSVQPKAAVPRSNGSDRSAVGRFSGSDQAKNQTARIEELEAEIRNLKEKLDDSLSVREFFLNKLKAIEFLCLSHPEGPLEQHLVFDIL